MCGGTIAHEYTFSDTVVAACKYSLHRLRKLCARTNGANFLHVPFKYSINFLFHSVCKIQFWSSNIFNSANGKYACTHDNDECSAIRIAHSRLSIFLNGHHCYISRSDVVGANCTTSISLKIFSHHNYRTKTIIVFFSSLSLSSPYVSLHSSARL